MLVPQPHTPVALVSRVAFVLWPLKSSFLLSLLLARDDNKISWVFYFLITDVLGVAQLNELCLSQWFLNGVTVGQ